MLNLVYVWDTFGIRLGFRRFKARIN